MNKITDLFIERSSCRSYKEDKVKDIDIEKILYDATLAPSTNNRQPWTFSVVENKEIKDSIAKLLNEKGIEQSNSAFIKTATAIKEAPVLICVFNKIIEDESISIIQSIGACIENMLLSAQDLGLSTLWIRATSCIEKEIESMLGKEEHLMACVTIGYSNEKKHPKNRKLVKDITTWYK